jgi:hypothetical protein
MGDEAFVPPSMSTVEDLLPSVRRLPAWNGGCKRLNFFEISSTSVM